MEKHYFHQFNPRYTRPNLEDNDTTESLRLPPLNLDQYPNNNIPMQLPHISALSPGQHFNDEELKGKSAALSQVQVSSTRHSQASANFSSWIKDYRISFPSFYFYFNKLDPTTIQELRYNIEKFGGNVEENYNEKVTHVIFLPPTIEPAPLPTLNPHLNQDRFFQNAATSQSRFLSPYYQSPITSVFPNSGHQGIHTPTLKIDTQEPPLYNYPTHNDHVLRRAEESGLKLWPVDAYQRGSPKPLVVPNRNFQESVRLPSLPPFTLPSIGKTGHRISEVHFFKTPYVLVEDMSGMYRPAVAAEYGPSKDSDAPWPKLYNVPTSRCPFVKIQSRRKHSHLSEKRRSGTPAATGELDLLHSRPCILDGKGPSNEAMRLAALPNRFLKFEKQKNSFKCLPPPNRHIRTKSSAAATPANTKKPGYCENCRQKYSDIEEHILCRTHREFATKEANFFSLDNLLRGLVRRQKTQPGLNESSSPQWYGKSVKDYTIERPFHEGLTLPRPFEYTQQYP